MWWDCLVSVIVVFSLSALWWRRVRGLGKLPDGRDWLRGKLGLLLMRRAMLSKSLVQRSVDGQSCVPSLLFDLRPAMVEVMRIMVTSFKRFHAHTATLSSPNAVAGHCQATRLLETPGRSWESSGAVSCEATAPFSWVLVHTRFCLCPPRVCSPSPVWVLVALWWG